MLAIGLLLHEDEPFGALLQRCAVIERVNHRNLTESTMRIARP